ncbi:hypothetical protein TELCIR_22921, partial [Teladorsagia circumcincta]
MVAQSCLSGSTYTASNCHISRNEILQDMAGKTPFDMSQYKFMYGTTRIPRKGCDEIRYGCANENQSKHIIAIHNGH